MPGRRRGRRRQRHLVGVTLFVPDDGVGRTALKTESKRDSAYEAWKQGRAAVLSKDETEARRFFQKSIETDQSYAPPYNSLGSIAFANKDYDATIAWSARALQRRPSPLQHRPSSRKEGQPHRRRPLVHQSRPSPPQLEVGH